MTDDLVNDLRLNADWSHLDVCLYREAADRIEKLEAALREIAYARPECCCISDAIQGIARKALEGKDD
jgi:hypothetical protein